MPRNPTECHFLWSGKAPLPSAEVANLKRFAAGIPGLTKTLWAEKEDSLGEAAADLRGAGFNIQTIRDYELPPDHKLSYAASSDRVRQELLKLGGMYRDLDQQPDPIRVQALEVSKSAAAAEADGAVVSEDS